MWVRGAAIRPVPPHAIVAREVLERVEDEFAGNGLGAKSELDDAFERFERTQPALAQQAAEILARPLDETALALGYFLTIAVWLAFERAFGSRLAQVTEEERAAADEALTLEEELRASHAEEPLELEDVMAMEQPGILAFVNEHVEAALEPIDDGNGVPREVDVDDVHVVYRNILVQTLALSHAVKSTETRSSRELLA
ncbi:MAG: hypothetical protein U0270_37980 [Labilithrix sp.]